MGAARLLLDYGGEFILYSVSPAFPLFGLLALARGFRGRRVELVAIDHIAGGGGGIRCLTQPMATAGNSMRRPVMIGIDCNSVQTQEIRREFFCGDVDAVAKALIGVFLFSGPIGGRIVETEAYGPNDDPGAHCYYDKRPREERRYDCARAAKQQRYFDAMYLEGGHLYIYCDDSSERHCHLNFTTGTAGVCGAVLIRAIEPCRGSVEQMISRRLHFVTKLSEGSLDQELCSGPQKLWHVLGITRRLNGRLISETPLKLFERKDEPVILRGARFGVTQGAELKRRYALQGSAWVSQRKSKKFPPPAERV